MQSFYSASRYEVIETESPDLNEDRKKYGLRNKETGVVEYYIDTFDNAMIAAETMSYILDKETWKEQVRSNIRNINGEDWKEAEVNKPLDS